MTPRPHSSVRTLTPICSSRPPLRPIARPSGSTGRVSGGHPSPSEDPDSTPRPTGGWDRTSDGTSHQVSLRLRKDAVREEGCRNTPRRPSTKRPGLPPEDSPPDPPFDRNQRVPETHPKGRGGWGGDCDKVKVVNRLCSCSVLERSVQLYRILSGVG